MMSFSLSGGVEVLGFISPTDPLDTYPVIDPLYGIDGLRNVNTITDLIKIPIPRRRAGMIVGVSGGTEYYKLKSEPWDKTINDWEIFDLGSELFVTGFTYNQDNLFTINRNDGVNFSVTVNNFNNLKVNNKSVVTDTDTLNGGNY